MTDYERPSTLEEALSLRSSHPAWTILAGGTDLMVGNEERAPGPGVLDLFGLTALSSIDRSADSLRIGAAVTYRQLLESPEVEASAPLLVTACREVGALQIQERGTLGGNIATCSPVGDTLPVLLALDAEIELASTRGVRRVPIADFIVGYRATVLETDELIVAVAIPNAEPDRHTYWRKVGTRRAQSISKLMLASSARLAEDGVIHSARIAFGGVADRPLRLHEIERRLDGNLADEVLASDLADRRRAFDGALPAGRRRKAGRGLRSRTGFGDSAL